MKRYLLKFYTRPEGNQENPWEFFNEKEIELKEKIDEFSLEEELKNFNYHAKTNQHNLDSCAEIFELTKINLDNEEFYE